MFAERLDGVFGAGGGVAAAGGRQGRDAAAIKVDGQEEETGEESADHVFFCRI